jgi:hypothetical protein
MKAQGRSQVGAVVFMWAVLSHAAARADDQEPTGDSAAVPAAAKMPSLRLELKTVWNVFRDYGPAHAFDGFLSVQFGSARIMATAAPLDWLSLDSHGVVEIAAMNIDSPLLAALGADAVIVTAPEALPLQASYYDRAARFQARARFDRLNARATAGPVAVVLGRQPISIGFASLFPLLDRIVPVPITALEREYVPGIDAAQVEAKLEDTTVRAIYAFGGDWDANGRGAFATRRAIFAATVESDLLGGKVVGLAAVVRDMPLAGIGYRRKLDSVGFTAELAGVAENSPVTTSGGFVMATAGVDLELRSGTYLLFETCYLGFAATDPRDYPALLTDKRLLDGDLPLYFNRHQAGVLVRQPLPRSMSVSLLALAAADGSGVVIPTLTVGRDDGLAAKLVVHVPFGARPDQALVPNSEYALVIPTAGFELRRTF